MFSYRLIIVFLLLCLACETPKDESAFFREYMLIRYLNEKTEINTKSEFIIVLANTSDCGACSKGDLEKMKNSSIYSNNLKPYILFTNRKEELLNAIDTANAEVLYVEDLNELEKYGLRLINTYIFHFKNGNIVNWDKTEF